MFKNSGKKIMGLANFLFYLNLIVIILAVAGGTVYAYNQLNTEQALTVLLGGLAAGFVYMLLIYFGLVFVYAFGEQVQNTTELRRIVAQLQLDSQRPSREPQRSSQRREAPAAVAAEQAAAVDAAEAEFPDFDMEFIPKPAQNPTVNLAYDYKAAAGAPPVYPVANPTPQERTNLFCPKCGGKHELNATHCRYCATPLR